MVFSIFCLLLFKQDKDVNTDIGDTTFVSLPRWTPPPTLQRDPKRVPLIFYAVFILSFVRQLRHCPVSFLLLLFFSSKWSQTRPFSLPQFRLFLRSRCNGSEQRSDQIKPGLGFSLGSFMTSSRVRRSWLDAIHFFLRDLQQRFQIDVKFYFPFSPAVSDLLYFSSRA